jgi:ATP-dependent RNA helicase RhlE
MHVDATNACATPLESPMQLMKFSELGRAAPILKALHSAGYHTPTAIQVKAIPIILTGRDALGIAQTGTGKTAAFALPVIHRLSADRRRAPRKGCRVLVLTPTRELASQAARCFRVYGQYLGTTVAVVFGGVGHASQIQALARGVDVLVATPGRLIDHIAECNITLASTEVLALDEADQMLDLGLLPAIRRIVSELAPKRQSLFFSATMPPKIGRLADQLLRDPARIAVAPVATLVDSVTQLVIHTENHQKRFVLVELFADPQMSRAAVFTRTKRGADRVAHHLETAGIRVAAIHGNKSQSQREHALAAFRAARIRARVATDIAARGIDIEQVTHVVNYELPDVPERNVHRIGRTARAGATGTAISLCDASERDQLHDIERLIRQSIPAEDRRSGAGRLDNRPPHPHMWIQSGRTTRRAAIRRPVDGHKFPARGRRQRSFSRRSHWHNDPNGGLVSFRSGRSRAGVSRRAPLRGSVRLRCSSGQRIGDRSND